MSETTDTTALQTENERLREQVAELLGALTLDRNAIRLQREARMEVAKDYAELLHHLANCATCLDRGVSRCDALPPSSLLTMAARHVR